jgi:hypothetical protein
MTNFSLLNETLGQRDAICTDDGLLTVTDGMLTQWANAVFTVRTGISKTGKV